ncbi:DNA cytosine methyltransferase [Fundicoccus sp. Sow4_D5]|uniref:DNA cytosine methyltransferase n=1 Tax=Fundicoccus sp. Sow4_D5 TaxID=3438782 RepID=UPI003F8FBB30
MIKTISLFSGGGGLDLGFQQNGFEIIYAIDNDKEAVASYKKNVGPEIVLADINTIDINTLPNADLIIGGPPCQSFSLVGKRNTTDERAQLVWKYMEIIEHIQPKYFVFENVVGLKSAKTENGTKVIDELILAFEEIGYKVEVDTLNSADYGVPQRRKRVFLVGNKLMRHFEFPLPTHSENGKDYLKKWVSSKEAIEDLGDATNDGKSEYKSIKKSSYQKLMRENVDSDLVENHFYPQMSDLDKQIISYVKPGGNYMDVPDHVPSQRIRNFKKTGGRTTCYGRLSPDKPSYTINTFFNRPNVGCNIHYTENRLITVREALRFQSFPDNYVINSKTKRGYHTIVGNAVPPLLADSIAKEVKKHFMSN